MPAGLSVTFTVLCSKVQLLPFLRVRRVSVCVSVQNMMVDVVNSHFCEVVVAFLHYSCILQELLNVSSYIIWQVL